MNNPSLNDSTNPGWSKTELTLYIGVPVAAVCLAGAAYYIYSSSSSSSGSGDGENDLKSTKEIELEKDPLKRAENAKLRGNKYFKGKAYEQAITCYSDAISTCPQEHTKQLATFYQNRAAAYEQLKNWEAVLSDSSKAIEYDNKYSKALSRRARAYESMKMLRECLQDATAVCLIEGFANKDSISQADRVLKELGKSLATEHYKNRKFMMPSPTFVRSYMESFHNDVFQYDIIDDDGETHSYYQACDALEKGTYENILDLCSAEVDSDGKYMAKALLLRATLHTLMSNVKDAFSDFDSIMCLEMTDEIKMIQVNALIKRGSLFMQENKQEQCFADFEQAEKLDPDNADIFHHRGQIHFLTEKLDKARDDFAKAIKLAPTFVHPKLQVAYCTCRLAMQLGMPAMLQEANTILEETTKDFPSAAEAWSLYGQLLQDQQRFDEAKEKIEKAISLQPSNPTNYVYKALLALQSRQDIPEAQALIEKAIEVDEKCDFAYETLATLHVQMGNLDKAVEYFEKAIELVRTEAEMAHTYSLLEAAKVQGLVTKKLGIKLPTGNIM